MQYIPNLDLWNKWLKHHGLHHTRATLALREGIGVHVVSDRLDHSSTHITSQIHTHVTWLMQSDAAPRILGSSDASLPNTDRRCVGYTA